MEFLARKNTFALIPGSKYESRLFGKKKVNPIEIPGYDGKSTFWREKSDFIKTPGDKVYFTFWREKRHLHLYLGLYTRVDFSAKKSRPHRKSGL